MSHLSALGATSPSDSKNTVKVWSQAASAGRGIEYDPEVNKFMGYCPELGLENASRAATRRAFRANSQECTVNCRKCFSK